MRKRIAALIIGLLLTGNVMVMAGDDGGTDMPLLPDPDAPVGAGKTTGGGEAKGGDEVPEVPEVPDVPDVPDVPGSDQPGSIANEGEGGSTAVDVPTGGTAGEISAAKVNIRSGPGASGAYEIVVTVNKGTKVVVYGKKDGWYQIGYPAFHHCSIHQSALQGDVPGEIPLDGVAMTVAENNVPVRVRHWNQSTEVCRLNKGDIVTVIGMRGLWAKIKPPAAARAWVYGKYVKIDGELKAVDVAQDAVPVAPSKQLTKSDKQKSVESDIAKRVEEKRKARLEEFRRKQEDERRVREEAKRERIAAIEAKLKQIEEQMIDKAPVVQIDEDPANNKESPESVDVGGRRGGVTGWIEYVGMSGRRPAAYRLVKGGVIRFLLRSSKYDLRQYVNRRVYVDGTTEEAPGFEANVLVVDILEKLSDPPLPSLAKDIDVRFPYHERPKPEPMKSIDGASDSEKSSDNTVAPDVIVSETGEDIKDEGNVDVKKEGEGVTIINEKDAGPESEEEEGTPPLESR